MGVKEDEDDLLVFLPQSTGGPSITSAPSQLLTVKCEHLAMHPIFLPDKLTSLLVSLSFNYEH